MQGWDCSSLLCPSNSAPAGDGTGCHSDVALYRHTELAREGQDLAPAPWVLAAASWRLEAVLCNVGGASGRGLEVGGIGRKGQGHEHSEHAVVYRLDFWGLC